MAAQLTEEEITYWREFHRLYPLDDLHRIYRPAALLYSGGVMKGQEQAFAAALDVLAPRPKKATRPLRAARVIKGKKA